MVCIEVFFILFMASYHSNANILHFFRNYMINVIVVGVERNRDGTNVDQKSEGPRAGSHW